MSYEKLKVRYKSIEPWGKDANPFDDKWKKVIQQKFKQHPVLYGEHGLSVYRDQLDEVQFCSFLGYVASIIMLQQQKLLPAKF